MMQHVSPKFLSQADLFPEANVRSEPHKRSKGREGVFTDNMKLPVHRWFRYSAGFSAEWAAHVIERSGGSSLKVLDPFAGSGTTMLAAQSVGATSIGLDAHPFVARVASAKLLWSVNPASLMDQAQAVLTSARAKLFTPPTNNALLLKCYDPETLSELNALKSAYLEGDIDADESELVWLAITAILRECSHAGTAQWQYVLPNKSKASVKSPFDAFAARIRMFAEDMDFVSQRYSGTAKILRADARSFAPTLEADNFDLVVTSPPYPNNYDYADATRLEMSFWGEVESWGDLHPKVRHLLLCSSSQHAAAERLVLEELLAEPLLEPIRAELTTVCHELGIIRETKSGKKAYHTMIAAYYLDLARVWGSMRKALVNGGVAHFVIGDSAPYGVYAPADLWLGELALAAGFKAWSFEKLRDRNIKWKNRKHTVPLKEGILTVQG